MEIHTHLTWPLWTGNTHLKRLQIETMGQTIGVCGDKRVSNELGIKASADKNAICGFAFQTTRLLPYLG